MKRQTRYMFVACKFQFIYFSLKPKECTVHCECEVTINRIRWITMTDRCLDRESAIRISQFNAPNLVLYIHLFCFVLFHFILFCFALLCFINFTVSMRSKPTQNEHQQQPDKSGQNLFLLFVYIEVMITSKFQKNNLIIRITK